MGKFVLVIIDQTLGYKQDTLLVPDQPDRE